MSSPARGRALFLATAPIMIVIALIAPVAHDGVARAYVGPAAGIVIVGSFLTLLGAAASSILFILTYPVRLVWRTARGRRALARAKARRVVVLGLDGLETTLTERFMDEGILPNLAALRERGAYRRLATTSPPLSPVAWSSFTTGANPGKHAIFDFIARRPSDYRPLQSSVRTREGRRSLRIGRLRIPLSPPRITGLRRSKPFWSVLGESGIFSAILRVPITFPPDRFRGVQLSAMCVPDLRGTHGTFSFFTDGEETSSSAASDAGGDVVRVERSADGNLVRGALRGPGNPLREGHPELRVPFRVTRARGGGDRHGAAAILHVGGQRVPLVLGAYTPWVRVRFRAGGGLVKVRGVCRFRLESFDPFALYCTPVQIDPARPVMPISHPRSYSRYLAGLQGDYSTLGLAEDTWALSERRIDEDAFLRQAYDIHAERERMFFDALRRVRRGCVTCVFDGPDRIQHMFWRFIDEGHPALGENGNGRRHSVEPARHRDVIRDMYRRMDDLVGRTVAALDGDTVLFVMSDHGFTSFRRGVDLNAWLRDEGYLALRDGAAAPAGQYLADVDWERTRAYAIGLAGIFLNVRGREGRGVVEPGAAEPLRREIAAKLTGLRDVQVGAVAVREAMPRGDVYHGPYVEDAPDVVVGYAPGYRVSWEAVLGGCGREVFADNVKAWSGDHCVHPAHVPGVLFASRPLGADPAAIVDLAPTVLDLFGVRIPAYMDGKSLL
jgi:predicted AlkP superfamily phosphohydrolase/phosphomutase